ncbi:metallophosphoesterase family protein [Pseudohoeflea coraliihabitans]|uniref:Serine/threonine protein phosphatase n=1 Tax=Pseudohoeflea coraliihabitans TaxID=2860393 RepID=A0ABS6WNZ0_9HYPH|nr:metallophosphoesterase family protein [Pseudohoeflea sp. DP4N28-3]MBW3097122.1 serine/threonine protein phosphatase [Pseudohoeflea sp. DP4N28-3]
MTTGISFETAEPPAGMRIVAIGDVHGCREQLARLLDRVEAEIARDGPEEWRIVMLGDYVDRGPESRGVLDLLTERSRDPRFICLAGNHDDRMLEFLRDSAQKDFFLRFGGRQTAESYGVNLDERSEAAFAASRQALAATVPAQHLRFLEALPASAEFGDFFFCHAGIRPGVSLAQQSRNDLTWIRREFLDFEGPHPRLIVHGHTPHAAVQLRRNRVNIDTCAFDTGVLTALVAEGRRKWLLQTGPDGARSVPIPGPRSAEQ